MLTLINSTCGTVCPACAGMIRLSVSPPVTVTRLPRMRGDDPDVMKALVALKEFAPHARG